jgi:hypothetical protein
MFIRIEDMKLLDVDHSTIRKILENARVNDDLISNLLRGRFTPVNYSESRFEQKVKYIEDAFEKEEETGPWKYRLDEDWAFPESELDDVKRDWRRKDFFPDGYNPGKIEYQKDKKGRTIYKDGEPIPVEEPGIFKKGIEKIKQLVNPFSDLQAAEMSQKPQAPPLPNTPMPNVAAAAMQKSPQTGLTRTETALLSPSEQEIARRT